MPSPDVAAYVGLDLVDLDEQTLIDEAFASVGEKFSDYVPREGQTDVVLIEGHAKMVADLGYLINQLPNGMAEILLRLFDARRDPGAPPQAQVTFTLADDSGYTIPAGTVVRVDLGVNTDPLDLLTEVDLVIAASSTTGTVTASGSTATIAGNGQPAGTALEVLDAIPYVETVELATDLSGGRVAEDGEAFLARVSPRLQRLTNTVVRAVDFETWVAENADVMRVRILDKYDPDGGSPGTDLGHVTAAVAGAGGAMISDATKAAIQAQLVGASHSGLAVHVVDADVTTVDVALTVLRYSYASDADVQAAVAEIVRTYLDPDSWAWGDTVRVNELIAVADRAAGVDTVLAVTTPGADMLLSGVAPLAKAGTVTVTVTAP